MTIESEGAPATYACETIERLEGPAIAREVPGMFIGDVHDGSGLHYLVDAVVTLCLDEHLEGRCQRADVTLRADGSVVVRSDGRQVVAFDGRYQPCPGLDRFTCYDHRRSDRPAPRRSFGLYRPFCPALNAVSERLTLDFAYRDRRWRLAFERGALVAARSSVGDAGETVITFTPDPLIFSDTRFCAARLEGLLRRMSFMVPGFTLTLTDERSGGERRVLHSPGGVADLLRDLDTTQTPLFDEPIVLAADAPLADGRSMHVDLALRWRHSHETTVASAVNGWRSLDEAGTQVAGLRDALPDCLAAYAIEAGLLPRRAARRRDAFTGLTAVVSFWHPEPRMWPATLKCLTAPEARPFVAATVRRQLFAWLRAHPAEARAIVLRAGRR